MTERFKEKRIRGKVPEPPAGRKMFGWYGPGLLWMLSSVGSGSVLFTPRVGSRYGYTLLWAALLVILAQWVIIREVGRYTVVTGRTLLDGFGDLPGPQGWAIWVIFLPQIAAAVVTIAGIAALAGSALMIDLPGSQALYASGIIIVSIILVVTGRYKGIEKISSVMAGILVLTALTAAVLVFGSPGPVLTGLAPSVPDDFDIYFVLPWLGFILAGAAGVMWFSYWVAERGYGGEIERGGARDEPGRGRISKEKKTDGKDLDQRIDYLRKWLRIMSTTAAIGVGSGAIVVASFLILGSEVLRPEGIVPQGIRVAEQLTRLLSEVWGSFGYWVLLVGIVVALWGTVLADQDGWGRTFADATLLLRGKKNGNRGKWLGKLLSHDRERLKNIYAVGFTAVFPLLIFWLVREPVQILSVGGIIAAVHTPVIVFLTHYLNRRQLPRSMQAGRLMSAALIASGIFFLAFAVVYLLDLMGVKVLQAFSV